VLQGELASELRDYAIKLRAVAKPKGCAVRVVSLFAEGPAMT
jgi:hypothetical protein